MEEEPRGTPVPPIEPWRIVLVGTVAEESCNGEMITSNITHTSGLTRTRLVCVSLSTTTKIEVDDPSLLFKTNTNSDSLESPLSKSCI